MEDNLNETVETTIMLREFLSSLWYDMASVAERQYPELWHDGNQDFYWSVVIG